MPGLNGLRETLNAYPKIAIAACAVIAAAALALGISSAGFYHNRGPRARFYSADDGKTWFAAETNELPPIHYQGTLAYRAYVLTNDGGKTMWVSYLERLSDDAKAKIDGLHAAGTPIDPNVWNNHLSSYWEVKRPGGDKWVKRSHVKAAAEVTQPHAPNGGDPATIVVINP